MSKKILIIAGEASSDCHAASLVKAVNSIMPDISFHGLGGDDMQNVGVNLLYNIVNLAVIGPVDLIKNYGKLRKIYNDLCAWIRQNRMDCAILIDYPSFNLNVAKVLKGLNVPVIYYISPQVWAWGRGRVKQIRQLVDKMLVLFEFEEQLYKKESIDVSFVGHPLLDSIKETKDKNAFLFKYRLDDKKTTIGILPGSRNKEVTRILPVMLGAAKLVQDAMGTGNVQFLLPVAKTLKKDFVKDILKETDLDITLIDGDTHNALSLCKVAMVASGTATLETAVFGVPMAIVYKVAPITYWITRAIIRIPYIGMVNVIAQEKIIPEFIQYEAKPKPIAEHLIKLLKDEGLWRKTKGRLLDVKGKLGSPGASMRAAKEVVGFLDKR